jgi:hypothetical protein
VDVVGCVVADGPVDEPQAHVRGVGACPVVVDVGVEHREQVRCVPGDVEAQGDEVEVVVAAGGAGPVDDSGDVSVGDEDVAGVVVEVDEVVAGDGRGAGADGVDQGEEPVGPAGVGGEGFVQAEAGSAVGEVQVDGGDLRVVVQEPGLARVSW